MHMISNTTHTYHLAFRLVDQLTDIAMNSQHISLTNLWAPSFDMKNQMDVYFA